MQDCWAYAPATKDLNLKIGREEQTYANIWQTSRLTQFLSLDSQS
jgi:hypothetical protein